MASEERLQEVFKRLKPVCVPLLGSSLLSPSSVPNVLKLLDELRNILLDVKTSGLVLAPSLISYAFFPLSSLLHRNTASDIPDQILEKVFIALAILCEDWWWDCDLPAWEQIFMLCGAVIAGIEAKGKGRDRDEETKDAAGRCLLALLHPRTPEEGLSTSSTSCRAQARLEVFQGHARKAKFLPILGQTLDSLLVVVDTPHLPLQQVSLEILTLIIGTYAPDEIIPSILPGVVSRMTRLSLGTSTTKGWASGETVAGALKLMQFVIVCAVGDDICAKEGAIHYVVNLEDLAQSAPEERETSSRRFSTPRTPSWLRGTSSQLLIALNSLTPLVSHPTPSALLALAKFSAAVMGATSMTLPDAQPLLLHFLLSLSTSDFPSVAAESHGSLLSLLTTSSKFQHRLQQTLLRTTNDNLLAIPRLLLTHADAKVEHVVGIVEAVCRLVSVTGEAKLRLASISTGIGKLLGPTGGIEKWGWSMLSVLELTEPKMTLSHASSARLMLESNPDEPQWVAFPDVEFRNVFSSGARNALERMFRALGRAGGDRCLFSVEWFASVGRSGIGPEAITATWCACRLLEGVASISLSQEGVGEAISARPSKRLMKLARALARSTAELWDEAHEADQNEPGPASRNGNHSSPNVLIEHVKGIDSIHETLRIIRPPTAKEVLVTKRPGLHRAFSLQLLAVSAGILQAQFTSLFINTLYPVLRSLVSSDVYLSSTALATLNYMTVVMSYASPGNLLLSNFDYALDAVSRRLSRRWLDVEATKVLALMVRLVGGDIVEHAGDVVEECFDRLDEFHGYGIIVEGLVEVLGDVVNVVREDVKVTASNSAERPQEPSPEADRLTSMDDFFHWYSHRHEKPDEEYTTAYGPAPHKAWGKDKISDVDTKDQDISSQEPDPDAEPHPTPIQALTKQIVSRSLYFLTHGSPVIRARILSLLTASVSVLPESALLPSIHYAWPFILNRLVDPEPFVVSAGAHLVESLATHVGSFMFRRIWDDVWPKFRVLLSNLDAADATSALSRRGPGAVGTESAYTHSHRLYRSVIETMTAAVKGVHLQETSTWQLLLAFRRFLHYGAHQDLQHCARDLYLGVGEKNPDAVWLVLSSAMDNDCVTTQFLVLPSWDINANATAILQALGHDHATG